MNLPIVESSSLDQVDNLSCISIQLYASVLKNRCLGFAYVTYTISSYEESVLIEKSIRETYDSKGYNILYGVQSSETSENYLIYVCLTWGVSDMRMQLIAFSKEFDREDLLPQLKKSIAHNIFSYVHEIVSTGKSLSVLIPSKDFLIYILLELPLFVYTKPIRCTIRDGELCMTS